MFDRPSSTPPAQPASPLPMVLAQKSVRRCHVYLPGMTKPTSAILYNGRYYAYVKFFSTLELAKRPIERLIEKGNAIVLTKIPKGFVLWVLEPDARLATK